MYKCVEKLNKKCRPGYWTLVGSLIKEESIDYLICVKENKIILLSPREYKGTYSYKSNYSYDEDKERIGLTVEEIEKENGVEVIGIVTYRYRSVDDESDRWVNIYI